MRTLQAVKDHSGKFLVAGVTTLATMPAFATMAEAAEAALTTAKSDATTVATFVIGAVAVIVCVGIIVSLIKKA